MKNLASYLATPEGQATLTKVFDHLLRSKNFAALETMLRHYFNHHSSDLIRAAREAIDQPLHFDSKEWDMVNRAIVAYGEDKKKVAAIGFDLTGHWDVGEDVPGLGLEINYYADEVDQGFLFSEHSPQQILAAAKYPCPWQGAFIQCEGFSLIYGLDDLSRTLWKYKNRAYYARKNPDAPVIKEDPAGFFLALFTLHLKVQKAFVEHITNYGLPWEMPVLLGTHDYLGRYNAYNVIMSEKIAQHNHDYQTIQAENRSNHKQFLKKQISNNIERHLEAWLSITGERHPPISERVLQGLEIYKRSLNSVLKEHNIAISKEFEDMNVSEFKSIMEQYYRAAMSRA